ncbi:hypothetical protein Taro_042475 [Colocasia esculenta]|uniref:Uncharacterized protein n=1 Tax=Colocasia esculenta TaxID=4460 RepID=A0A843WIJ6_COLES|nr:hypothetical protein [Colocasia esculenta]
MFMEKHTESLSESRPNYLEGARTDMDEERLLAKSMQHMSRREMARNLHNNESESGCQSRGQQAYKRVRLLCDPLVQIGVVQPVDDREGCRGGGAQLDPEVWVAASGAPKKGHVYSFGHSMDTSKMLSGTSSSGSQATSAFITPGAPGASPSEMMGFIRDEFSGLGSRLVHSMHAQVSDVVHTQLSQTIS